MRVPWNVLGASASAAWFRPLGTTGGGQLMAQVHGMLQSTFRERRGVVMLLGVPPEVGFALMQHFAKPSPAINKKPIYDETHPSWKQGTNKGGTYHFIQLAYDNTEG